MTDMTDAIVNVNEKEAYLIVIAGEKIKRTKNNHQTLLLNLSVASGDIAGMTIWHNIMLVHATNQVQTANWLLRAGRDLGQMLGIQVGNLNPQKLKELRERGIAGEAFEATLKVRNDEEYGTSIVLNQVIRHVTQDEVSEALGLSDDIDFTDPTAVYSGMQAGDVF